MSKAMNSRCQGRKSGTVTQKCIFNTPERLHRRAAIKAKWLSQEQSDPPRHKREKRDLALVHDVDQTRERFHQFRRLVLCSLLGNYRHSRVRITHPDARRALYQQAMGETTGEAWLQSLLHQAGDLVQWCVRDFIVAVLEDTPALHASVAAHIHFDEFRELTQQAMAQVRAYLDQQLVCEWSHASRAFSSSSSTFTYCTCLASSSQVCLYADSVWLEDLCAPLRLNFHERFLACQYYKPHTDVVGWLVSQSVRAALPLVVRAGAPPPPTTTHHNEDDDTDDTDTDEVELAVSGNALQHLQRTFARQERQRKKQRQQQRPRVGSMWATLDARMYLTQDEFRALRQVVDTEPTLEAVVRRLFAPAVGRAWLGLLQAHRDAAGSKADRVAALTRLYHLDAHAYNLVQVGAELVKERHPLDGIGGRCLGYFSVQVQAAQIRAARSKLVDALTSLQTARIAALHKQQKEPGFHQLDIAPAVAEAQEVCARVEARLPADVVDARSTSLVFCRVCGLVYSNVRVTRDEQDAASVTTRKYYRYGLFDARHDYLTAQTYCHRRKVTHRGACHTTPLVSVSLLGRRYAFNGRQYQLCCGCGDIMSPDPKDAAWQSEGGMLCTVCTQRTTLQTKRAQEERRAAFLATLERNCSGCGHPTTGPSCTFLLPHSLVLCKKCAHPKVLAQVRELATTTTRDELRLFLGQLQTSHRRRKRERVVRRGAYARRLNKQKDRAKRA